MPPCCKWCSIIVTGGLIISSCFIHGTRTETVSSVSSQNVAISRDVEEREPFHVENEIVSPLNTGRVEFRTSENVKAVTQSFSHNIDAWIATPESTKKNS